MKLLHTADIHLGVKSSLNGDRLREKILKSFTHLCDKTIETGAQLLLIAGDLFDTTCISQKTILKVTGEFERLAENKCRVVILPGTHDPYDERSIYRYIKLPENIIVITEDEPFLLLRDEGVYITGKPYTGKQYGENALSGLKPHPDADTNIALVHGSFKRGDVPTDSMIFSESDLKNSGFDYIALGHWHNYQLISEDPPTVYTGSLEPLSLNHKETGNVVLIETSQSGKLTYKPIRVGSLRVSDLSIMVDELTTIEDVYKSIEDMRDENLILFVKFVGNVSGDLALDYDDLLRSYEDDFHYLQLDTHELEVRSPLEMGEVSERMVLGRFLMKISDRLQDAKDDEERDFWEDIKAEGLRRFR